MNLKVSFINFRYLLENIKKSKGVIFLFILIIPLFTYLFMLLSSSYSNKIYFPSLLELSIPAVFGMYVIPFVMAVTLFSFVFKKDSIDFINALPIKRSTLYITNIVGGILLFLFIFTTTSLFMWIASSFFDNLVIPKMMYFHYFITFFIAYIYVFITSSLALTLTGSRIVHVALTLILLFLPGFIGDFYTSLTYRNSADRAYLNCYEYGGNCDTYQIQNDFKLKDSYELDNEKTLPYKYINAVPRAVLGVYNSEINYNSEISSVYNIPSIIKMIMLSVIYFVLGFYAFIKRKMEIAETTFKSENIHQLVKCITLLPLSLAAITTFYKDMSTIGLSIFGAVILIIYVVYDLITRRNNTHFIKSVLYFLGFALGTILIFVGFNAIANIESSKKIYKGDISNIGIQPNASFDYSSNSNYDALGFKIYDSKIIDLIFNNANKAMEVDNESRYFSIRLTLKSGLSYYFNMRLPKEVYNKLLDLLSSKKDYVDAFKDISYDKIYGVEIGYNYFTASECTKIINLIREGYKEKSFQDIINSTYIDYNYYGDVYYDTSAVIYIYDNGLKNYRISSDINPDLSNYVIKMQNDDYIENVKSKNIDINQTRISAGFGTNNTDSDVYYEYLGLSRNEELLYNYINDNIKSNIDFSKYSKDEIIDFNVIVGNNEVKFYHVFLVKNEAYNDFINYVKSETEKLKPLTEVKGKI